VRNFSKNTKKIARHFFIIIIYNVYYISCPIYYLYIEIIKWGKCFLLEYIFSKSKLFSMFLYKILTKSSNFPNFGPKGEGGVLQYRKLWWNFEVFSCIFCLSRRMNNLKNLILCFCLFIQIYSSRKNREFRGEKCLSFSFFSHLFPPLFLLMGVSPKNNDLDARIFHSLL